MILKKTYLCLSICAFLCVFNLSSQEASNHTEQKTLQLIDSANAATDEGDYKKSKNLLSLAKASIDSSSSTGLLYKYYVTLGSLSFSTHQIEEAQNAYLKAIEMARKNKDTSGLVTAYSGKANTLLINNKFKKALVYQQEALDLLKSEKSKVYYGLLSNMSIAFKQAQDFDNSLDALLEVRDYFIKQDDKKSIAIVENNLGELYRENFQDYETALEHYHRAIKLNKAINDDRQLAQNYHNMSLTFNNLKQQDSAYFYIQKALEIKTESGDVGGLASSYYALGSIELENSEFDKAITSFQRSVEISEEYKITPGLYHSNMGIADAYLAKGNKAEALNYYKKVEEVSKLVDSYEMKAGIAKNLLEFYKTEQDYENAFLYSEKLQEIQDSISSIKSNDRLDELRVQYESSLAETENQVLKERERAQKQKIDMQNVFLIVSGIALVGFAILIIVLYRSNKLKKTAYKEVHSKTKELEKQYAVVKQREHELNRSLALKDKIFSVLGHDLRTPLANVSNLIDSMSQIELNPEEMEFLLKHLKGETTASLKTLENILQWARLQMNENSTKIEQLDEDGIIIEIITNLESHTEAKNIEVKYLNTSTSLLKADENQFRSIANNLIANAIKFSPIDGKIEINFKENDDYFIFTVSDQGEGIKPSIIENLETQDELLSTYGTEGEKGTGIGLRIVKDFINLHEGKLEFSKNEPQGTIVTVSFPKVQKTASVSKRD
ncbi:tetratricopeptide repeat-containing sensor histidine kinase [Planktosalinus lacus]|uniref:tetratricopeptide repeat-containing sensor histidine kinase n=1 Tax=Planktosalinus lacus TaxID=1526573 RepID=UPI001662D97A|nr:tetratricopeptide repeat protein [Planktosalinus lacus]